jgi:hypothetical protein
VKFDQGTRPQGPEPPNTGLTAPAALAEGRTLTRTSDLTVHNVEDSPMKEEMLTASEAAEAMGVDYAHLAAWRSAKKGPPLTKRPDGRIFYRRADVDTWLAAKRAADEEKACRAEAERKHRARDGRSGHPSGRRGVGRRRRGNALVDGPRRTDQAHWRVRRRKLAELGHRDAGGASAMHTVAVRSVTHAVEPRNRGQHRESVAESRL